MKSLEKSCIIICGIVRNAEKGLKKNIPVISQLCLMAKDYRVIIYENDSTDQTKKLLQEWRNTCPQKIHVSLNTFGVDKTIPSQKSVVGGVNPFFSRKRIEKMAWLRNKYMQYIDDNNWVADYLIVVDLDVAKLFFSPIVTSFTDTVEYDAVCAFGYSTSPWLHRRYHDTYALVFPGDELLSQTEADILRNANALRKYFDSNTWIRVASAFGGLAIYRFDAVKGLRYKVEPNNDARVEVRCEHFSIYKQMMQRGYNKFYINPKMILKYQSLTPKIIFNSLARKFSDMRQKY